MGLRTIALVRVPTPARPPGPPPGAASETFHFSVNGVTVWAKGANYIPPHVFHSRAPALALLATRLLRSPHAAAAARAVSTQATAASPPAVAERLSEDEGATGSEAQQPRWLRELGVIRNDWT